MTTFLFCSTDEQTYEDLIGYCPVLGTNECFTMTRPDFDDLDDVIQELIEIKSFKTIS